MVRGLRTKERWLIKTNMHEPKMISEEKSPEKIRKRMASSHDRRPQKKIRLSNSSGRSSGVSSLGGNEDVRSSDNKEVLSEEEKIYEMSSSENTNTNIVDFTKKYIQNAPIRTGGFGSVYTGYRSVDLLPVAIKHIPREKIIYRELHCNGKLYTIILEVTLMLKATGLTTLVRQSAFVCLLDWYLSEDELILVMERPDFCEDLCSYLQNIRRPLDECQAKSILRQLVDASIDMHSKGIFHRDIKLENVLIHWNPKGTRVRVIDFGCGTFSTQGCYTSFCGTHSFFPPEWFEHQAYWAHPTTVWQLGALFYSMLHKQHFKTQNFMKGSIQISHELSTDCKELLNMCLARDPTERATLEKLQQCPALKEASN